MNANLRVRPFPAPATADATTQVPEIVEVADQEAQTSAAAAVKIKTHAAVVRHPLSEVDEDQQSNSLLEPTQLLPGLNIEADDEEFGPFVAALPRASEELAQMEREVQAGAIAEEEKKPGQNFNPVDYCPLAGKDEEEEEEKEPVRQMVVDEVDDYDEGEEEEAAAAESSDSSFEEGFQRYRRNVRRRRERFTSVLPRVFRDSDKGYNAYDLHRFMDVMNAFRRLSRVAAANPGALSQACWQDLVLDNLFKHFRQSILFRLANDIDGVLPAYGRWFARFKAAAGNANPPLATEAAFLKAKKILDYIRDKVFLF